MPEPEAEAAARRLPLFLNKNRINPIYFATRNSGAADRTGANE